jgi:hypothetical protein
MSRSGEVTLDVWGAERSFRLGVKQWEKIDEKCKVGPPELLARLAPPFFARQRGLSFDQIVAAGMLGTWRLHDVRETILQGLLGANVAGPEALALVRDWVDDRPLIESAPIAYEIVLEAFVGTEVEEAAGEPVAAPAASPPSRTAGSASAKTGSMPSAPPAASPPPKSAP